MHQDLHVLILAAGPGTRMRSRTPQVLHEVCERTLVDWVFSAVRPLAPQSIRVVVPEEKASFASLGEQAGLVAQSGPSGPGGAVLAAREALAGLEGILLVVAGNAPLLTESALRRLLSHHAALNGGCALLAEEHGDPAALVFRLSSFFSLSSSRLPEGDLELQHLACALGGGSVADPISPERPGEALLVVSRLELSQAQRILQTRILERHMRDGVTFVDPSRVMVGANVEISPDVTVYPDVVLVGQTRIARNCLLLPGCFLENAELESGVTAEASVIRDSRVDEGTTVGPFAHIRGGASVGPRNRVGNFVEIKKSVTGVGTKASHLSYLGDATIGAGVNIGAGTITCNYDGVHKHPTFIGDGAFIGSDSTLVAPVRIGQDAYVGAGSTVTQEVPAGSLAISRGRQRNIEGWVEKRRTRRAEEKDRKE